VRAAAIGVLGAVLLVGCDCGGCDTFCDVECVDLSSDPAHCGACGAVCAGTCIDGVCRSEDDAGSSGDGAAADAAAATDAATRDDAGTMCLPGQLPCRRACASPYHYNHCGSTPERGCLEMPCRSNDGCDGVRCVPTSSPLDRAIEPDALFGGALIGLFNFVCPASLTPEVATVACRRWGLSEGEVIDGTWEYGATDTPYLVTCAGTEASLEECENTETTRGPACLEPARLVRCR
jgi:hypothetical protein